MKRLLEKIRAYGRVMRSSRRNQTDLLKHLLRRPAILAAVGTYESAMFFSSRVDSRLKALAQTKVAARVGCPF